MLFINHELISRLEPGAPDCGATRQHARPTALITAPVLTRVFATMVSLVTTAPSLLPQTRGAPSHWQSRNHTDQDSATRLCTMPSTTCSGIVSDIAFFLKLMAVLRVFGGYDLEHVFNDVLTYNFRAKVWSTLATSNTPVCCTELNVIGLHVINFQSPRFEHAAVLIGDGMYVFGGVLQSRSSLFGATQNMSTLTNELWVLNTTTSAWVQITSPVTPPPLAAHTLNAVNDSFYLLGGRHRDPGFSSSAYVFSTTTMQWQNLAVTGIQSLNVCCNSRTAIHSSFHISPLYKIAGHSATYHAPSNSIYVYGGYSTNIASTNSRLNTVCPVQY